MKNLIPALRSHLKSRRTSMAYCWRVTRNDRVVMGFTEHDADLTLDGVTHRANSGFTASSMSRSMGLAADTETLTGAITLTGVTHGDVRMGLYDNAPMIVEWVNWRDLTQRVTIARGHIGEIDRQQTEIRFEFRSLENKLNQTIGRKYQRTCDAELGDTRCKVNLNSSNFRLSNAVGAVVHPKRFNLGGASRYDDGTFSYGLLWFTSGRNSVANYVGKLRVKSHVGSYVDLYDDPPEPVSAGDRFTMVAGCDKEVRTCVSKFNNVANFRGFPHIPGPDLMGTYHSGNQKGQGNPRVRRLYSPKIEDLIPLADAGTGEPESPADYSGKRE